MMLLAHMGITLAAARQLEKSEAWRRSIHRYIDYRVVLIGSMLPDIIDKPLGGIILKETLGNGRIYSHTMLFLLLVLGTGIYLWTRHKKYWGLVLAGGCLVHHFLDGMWLYPETFLWPAYGFIFSPGNPDQWLSRWMECLFTNPAIYVPEIIGGIFILYFYIKIVSQKKLAKFIKTGMIGEAHNV